MKKNVCTIFLICIVFVLSGCVKKSDEDFIKNINALYGGGEVYTVNSVDEQYKKLYHFEDYEFKDENLRELAKKYFDALSNVENAEQYKDIDDATYYKMSIINGRDICCDVISELEDEYDLELPSTNTMGAESKLRKSEFKEIKEKIKKVYETISNAKLQAVNSEGKYNISFNKPFDDIFPIKIMFEFFDENNKYIGHNEQFINNSTEGDIINETIYILPKVQFSKVKMAMEVKVVKLYDMDKIKTNFIDIEYIQDTQKYFSPYSIFEGIFDDSTLNNYQAHFDMLKRDSLRKDIRSMILNDGNYEKNNYDIQIGEYITLGNYEQDNNISDGKEAIEWLVLDVNERLNQATLISRYGLDTKPYMNNKKYIEKRWEESDIRKWLNNDFYDEAFDEEEKKVIKLSKLMNDSYEFDYTSGGKNTEDKVYLLALYDVEDEFSASSSWENLKIDFLRSLKPTSFAIKNGAYVNKTHRSSLDSYGEGVWWLRTSADLGECAAAINANELIILQINNKQALVCPAIKISISDYKNLKNKEKMSTDWEKSYRYKLMKEMYNDIKTFNNIPDYDKYMTVLPNWCKGLYRAFNPIFNKDGDLIYEYWDYYGSEGYVYVDKFAGYKVIAEKRNILDDDFEEIGEYYLDEFHNEITKEQYVEIVEKYKNKYTFDDNQGIENKDENLEIEPETEIEDETKENAIENTKLEKTGAVSDTVKNLINIKSVKVGDIITFGNYYRDSTNNEKYPIEWQILDIEDNKALLISKYAIECKKFNNTNVDVTWEGSTVRKWLNDFFIASAFNDAEKVFIADTVVINDTSSGFMNVCGPNTMDKIFLLSYDEVKKYFNMEDNGNLVYYSKDARCQSTQYVNSLWNNDIGEVDAMNNPGVCTWILRTRCDPSYGNLTYEIWVDGMISTGQAINEESPIRPVLWINLLLTSPKNTLKAKKIFKNP